MANHRVLLDAFADARRTWDDVITLQPDVVAGSGNLREASLVELAHRVEAHQAAVDALVDALAMEPAESRAGRDRAMSASKKMGGRSK
jgi:hypothetical protein